MRADARGRTVRPPSRIPRPSRHPLRAIRVQFRSARVDHRPAAGCFPRRDESGSGSRGVAQHSRDGVRVTGDGEDAWKPTPHVERLIGAISRVTAIHIKVVVQGSGAVAAHLSFV